MTYSQVYKGYSGVSGIGYILNGNTYSNNASHWETETTRSVKRENSPPHGTASPRLPLPSALAPIPALTSAVHADISPVITHMHFIHLNVDRMKKEYTIRTTMVRN